MTEKEAMKKAARAFAALLAREKISCEELAKRMSEQGYKITANAIRIKLSRDSFTVGFLVAACEVLQRQQFNWQDN